LDPCILWRGNTILIIYTDDTIITGNNVNEIDTAIADIASIFEITSKDSVSDFLCVNIDRHDDNTVTLSQPKLIQTILDDLGLKEYSNILPIPAPSTRILHAHVDSQPDKEDWHYRSIIGKLNFLAQSTRPDISYAVHQCAR
jgi:Reverse transcriptase (RNA-dependent DNA polymerase)